MNVSVADYAFITTHIVDNIIYSVSDITFGESITFRVSLRSGNHHVDTRNVTIDGDDYKSWGSDDQYIVNKLIEKIGLQQKPAESS